jgi:hypothetical protein
VKSSVVLIGALLIGSAGASNAAPPDSPETVYIDGTPCNALCQSYMAWSRQTLAGSHRPHSPVIEERRAAETGAAKPKHAGGDRAQAQPAPIARQMQRDKIARLRPPTGTAIPIPPVKPTEATASAAPSAVSEPTADNAAPQQPAATSAPPSDNKPDEQVAAIQQPAPTAPPNPVSSVTAPPDTTAKAGDADGSNTAEGAKTKAITNQVIAATALAEQLTSASAAPPKPKASSPERADDTTASTSAGDNAAAPASPKETGQLVALVMTRRDVSSVSDLAGKTVAIDDGRSTSTANVRTALVAAGAGQVQLSSSDTKAIDRLVTSEVPAAVVTLVSPDAAETFPEIAGYKVFRIPLSP